MSFKLILGNTYLHMYVVNLWIKVHLWRRLSWRCAWK